MKWHFYKPFQGDASFEDHFFFVIYVSCLSNRHAFLSVHCSLVVTRLERAGLLALLYVVFYCVFVTLWCPGSGVVLDCIDS